MSRRALSGRPSRRRVSRSQDWIAPIGGWRTDVEMADMPANAAFVLDNFFPEANRVRARYGTQPYATGLAAAVQTVIPYSGASNKLFAAAGAKIYEITSPGAVGSAVVTGLTSAHWSTVQMTTIGGKFIRAFNGYDAPLLFDGTTWTSGGITGPTFPSALAAATVYKSRLWAIERGTTNLWYGATSAVSGAFTSLNVGDVMKLGGTLIAIGTWTIPVTAGLQQLLVLMSSEGELIIYQGSNPADASNWSLLGTFKLGQPLGGDRCFLSVGADLAIMTVDGIIPVTKAVALDRGATDLGSLTKAIAPTWLDAVANALSADGWQLIGFPRRRMAIVNVPATTGTVQFVMNTETGAWCRFTGLSAACWGVWQNRCFFGSTDGNVYEAEAGASDNGAPIDALMVGAWRRYGDGVSPKFVEMIGVAAQIGTSSKMWAGVSVDYQLTLPSASLSGGVAAAVAVARWGVAKWGVDTFPGTTFSKQFASSGAVGIALAPTVRALVSGSPSSPSEASVIGGTIMYEVGSPV